MGNWNFQGYIAVPLEYYYRKYLGNNLKSADDIALGDFVNVMFMILKKKYGSLDNFSDFKNLCEPFLDLKASLIPEEKAQKMFDEFKNLING